VIGLNRKKWRKPVLLLTPPALLLTLLSLVESVDIFLPLLTLLYVFIWL
jgi:hypothetical protein